MAALGCRRCAHLCPPAHLIGRIRTGNSIQRSFPDRCLRFQSSLNCGNQGCVVSAERKSGWLFRTGPRPWDEAGSAAQKARLLIRQLNTAWVPILSRVLCGKGWKGMSLFFCWINQGTHHPWFCPSAVSQKFIEEQPQILRLTIPELKDVRGPVRSE
jgi:hypothetical protein